jgi:hypothetical protein
MTSWFVYGPSLFGGVRRALQDELPKPEIDVDKSHARD